jgi:hypothetical protein
MSVPAPEVRVVPAYGSGFLELHQWQQQNPISLCRLVISIAGLRNTEMSFLSMQQWIKLHVEVRTTQNEYRKFCILGLFSDNFSVSLVAYSPTEMSCLWMVSLE